MSTATASSSAKRTSGEAGFFTSPPPKHRKLNSSLALAVVPAATKLDKRAALRSLANDQFRSAQEQALIDRYRRTWMIEFDSPIKKPEIITSDPGSLDSYFPTIKANLWRIMDCKSYDDCVLQFAIQPVSRTQWIVTCSVRLEGSSQWFQAYIHPNACYGRFLVVDGSFTRVDGEDSEGEDDTEEEDDEEEGYYGEDDDEEDDDEEDNDEENYDDE